MPYRPGVPISAGLLSKYCANQTDKFKSFPISLNSAVFPIFHFNQLPRVQRGCHVSYHFRVTSEMAGRQVTAIISQSGEPIRNIPWPLYYKPCQYNYPQWGESSQRGGSCDTTPATPESLLTDSVDTPTEFYPKFGQNKLGGRHSRASPELLSFSVSEILSCCTKTSLDMPPQTMSQLSHPQGMSLATTGYVPPQGMSSVPPAGGLLTTGLLIMRGVTRERYPCMKTCLYQ